MSDIRVPYIPGGPEQDPIVETPSLPMAGPSPIATPSYEDMAAADRTARIKTFMPDYQPQVGNTYMVEGPDQLIQRAIDILGPAAAEDETYKMLSSIYASQVLRMQPEDVASNWDAAVETWSGSKVRPRDFFEKTWWTVKSGSTLVELGDLYTQADDARIAGRDAAPIMEMIKKLEDDIYEPMNKGGIFPQMWYGGAEMAGQMFTTTLKGMAEGIKLGGAAAGTVALGSLITGPAALGVTPVSAGTAFMVGMTAGRMTTSYKTQRGLFMREIQKVQTESGKTIDPDVASLASMGASMLTAGLEVFQDTLFPVIGEAPMALVKKLGVQGLTGILRKELLTDTLKAASDKIEKTVAGAAAKKLASMIEKTAAAGALRPLAELPANMAAEVATEVLQDVINIGATEMAKTYENMGQTGDDRFEHMTTDAFISQLKDTATTMALSYIGSGGLMALGKSVAMGGQDILRTDRARATSETTAQMDSLRQAFAGTGGTTEAKLLPTGDYRMEVTSRGTGTDGVTRGDIKVASPDGKLYGKAIIDVDEDGVVIKELFVDPRMKDREAIAQAVIQKAAADNPGLTVDYRGPAEFQGVVDTMKAENPRGPEAGLQYYQPDVTAQDTNEIAEFRRGMAKAFKNVPTGQLNVIVELTARRAAAQSGETGVHVTPSEYIRNHFAGFTNDPTVGLGPDVAASTDRASRVLGSTVIQDSKAIVYASEHADFRTLSHEMFHGWWNEIEETSPKLRQQLRTAFGFQLDGKLDRTQQETMAAAWERFLEDGSASTPELKTLLQKAIEWMKSVYRTLSGQANVTPEIRAGFEAMFANPDHPINQVQETQENPSTQAETAAQPKGTTLYQEEARQIDEIRAKYQGTPEWMKAPNGSDTKLTEHQWLQVRTPAFKTWFGDWETDPATASKVVDENGEPQVVYHGTGGKDFESFSRDKMNTSEAQGDLIGKGIYAAPSIDTAEGYTMYHDENRRVMPVYMNLRNPLQIKTKADYAQWMAEFGGEDAYFQSTADQVAQKTAEHGYDGLIDGKLQVAAVDPSQVKSATGNTGTFNAADHRINYLESDPLYMMTEDDLRSVAAQNDTWEEFKGELEAFGDSDDNTETMTSEEKDAWYKDTFERKKNELRYSVDPATATEVFKGEIAGNLDQFLQALYTVLTDDHHGQALDEADAVARDAAYKAQSKARSEIHPRILNAAQTIGAGRELTPATRKAVLTLMKKDTAAPFYRRWYAEILDPSLAVDPAKDATGLPEIRDIPVRDRTITIEDRIRVLRGLKDEAIKARLATGDLVPEKELADYVASLQSQAKEAQGKIAELEAQVEEDSHTFSRQERVFRELRKDLAEREKAVKEANRQIKDAVEGRDRTKATGTARLEAVKEKTTATMEALVSARQEAKMAVREVRRQLEQQSGERIREVFLSGVEAKETAIQNLKDQMAEIAQRKKEAATIRDYKLKLSDAIMAKPSKTISYARRQEIIALQKTLDPAFRRFSNTLKWEKWQTTLGDSGLPSALVERLNKKDLNEWTIGELEELANEIQQLRYVGKQERFFEVLEWKKERQKDASQALTSVVKAGIRQDPSAQGSVERKNQLKKLNSLGREILLWTTAPRRIANWLDGGKDGGNVALLITKQRRAKAAKMAQMDRRMDRIHNYMKAQGIDQGQLYKWKKTVEGVGPAGSSATFTASDLMFMRIGLKDKNTREAIVFGNCYGVEEKIFLQDYLRANGETKFALLEAAVADLPENLAALADEIGKDFRDEFGRMNEVFIREFNETMAQVENYVPILRQDTAASGEKHEKQQAEELMNVGGTSIKRNPEKGFSIERIKIAPVNQRAIRLDLYGTWLAAVERQEHFTAYTHYARELNSVYKGMTSTTKQLRESIVNSFGSHAMKMVDEYINEVANPSSLEVHTDADRVIRSIRGNLGSAVLGWKLSGVIKQAITSPLPYLQYVSAKDMAVSTFELLNNRQAFEDAVKQSVFLKHRTVNPMVEYIRNSAKDTALDRGLGRVNTIGMKGFEIVDWLAVATGWRAVHDKVVRAIGDGKSSITLGDQEYRWATDEGRAIEGALTPVEIADDVTLKCQPEMDPAEKAALFKKMGGGEFTKAFTQFGTGLNVVWQQIAYDLPNAVRNRQFGAFVKGVGAYMLGGILLGLITKGHSDDDDEADKWRNYLYWSMTQATDSVPIVSSYVTALWQQIATGDKARPFQKEAFPLFSEGLSGMGRVVTALNPETEDPAAAWAKAAEDFGTAFAYGTGLPIIGLQEGIRTVKEGPGALVGRRKE